MEKDVRIMEQSPLMEREYADPQTGEMKKIRSVQLTLTDGLDSFVAEMSGERALNLGTLDKSHLYRVRCTLRTWAKQKEGGIVRGNNIYVDEIKAK